MSSTAIPLFGTGAGQNQYGPFGTGQPSSTIAGAGVYGAQPVAGSGIASNAGTDASGTPPGVVPTPPNTASTFNPYAPPGSAPTPLSPAGPLGGIIDQPGTGANTVSTLYPQYTNEYYNWLAQQVGTGTAPFDLSTLLPSSGQATTPGQVNAPLTGLLQQLQQFYSTGTGGPAGSSTLGNIAQTGNPVDQTPAWQAMVASEGQNTQQNEAQIREQFASLGNLDGSPFGTALTNYGEQTTQNQNASLTAAQTAAQQQAVQNQLTASTTLNSSANSLGSTLQGVDQSAIQNLISQYQSSLPQNNPLNSILYGTANTFPPALTQSSGSILSALVPALAGGAGGAASSAIGGGSGLDILLAGLAGL